MNPDGKKSKLEVGVDVPWVTSWSEEREQGVGVCPTVGDRLAILQDDRAGYGKPQYSMNHFVRQRASVGRMLCPMCGQPTAEGDRWTQVASRTTARRLRAVRRFPLPAQIPDHQIIIDAGAIAPLHLACVHRSLEHCPHLRSNPKVEVMAFPARWVAFPLYVEGVPDPGPRLVLANPGPAPRPIPIISFLQLCGVTDEIDAKRRGRLARGPRTQSPF